MRTIGGRYEVNTRYYIHNNQLYYRYDRRHSHGKMKALRRSDIPRAKRRVTLLNLFWSILLGITLGLIGGVILFGLDSLISKIGFNSNESMVSGEVVERIIEHDVSIDKIYGSRNEVEPKILEYQVMPTSNRDISGKYIGDTIEVESSLLREVVLPDKYYKSLDYSSFQAFEDYTKITNKKSPGYVFNNDPSCYTDSDGFRRHIVDNNNYSIDGIDDYVVALGTFYKEDASSVGERFLVVTETGRFTIITGDTKADEHTDSKNMFRWHTAGNKKRGCLIEYIVDTKYLHTDVKKSGTATEGPVEAMQGKILHMYEIKEKY